MALFRTIGCVAFLCAMVLGAPAPAAESVDFFDLPGRDQPELTFPDQPTDFIASGGANRMFKPKGAGPFPGLVLLPTCGGHIAFMNTFDWARRALAQGYAVLVVDPLGSRGVRENCAGRWAVGPIQFLKDGFAAADHLRKQPFVDPDHIGLMGFSLGAMAGLGASGSKRARSGGGKPFQAVVGLYPVCLIRNIQLQTGQIADLRFIPEQIEVPILVEMGDRDTEGPPTDCIPAFDALKAKGAPIEYRLYHATHNWDAQETRNKPFRKTGLDGQTIVYEYNDAVTEQSARDAFAFLDAHLKRK